MSECIGEISFVRKQNHLPDMIISADMYFADFKSRIQEMIGVVENMCYIFEGGKNKPEWNQFTSTQFQVFRKRMLDIADEVGTLGDNILVSCKNAETDVEKETSGLINALFNRKGR